MSATIDALTSLTLKHLRERWWNDDFTEFLAETLRPRPGNRILDVGCGEGLAEVAIGRLHISQVRLFGIDLAPGKAAAARRETAAHNQRAGFAAADACVLPFRDAAFDSLFCVAVLQHIGDLTAAAREFARVTGRNGRIVAVEPDNGARYFYSPTPVGNRAFEEATAFYRALAAARGDRTEPAVGPRLPALFAAHGIGPLDVRLFPVSQVSLGPPPAAVWDERQRAVEQALEQARDDRTRWAGESYLRTLREYRQEASGAGTSFVEIQNTTLFATVGQRT